VHLRGEVRSHHRGQLPEAGGGGRAAVHAGDPGHGGHGAVHRHARSVHEERPGIRVGLLDYGAIDVQRSAGPARADPAGQGHGRCAHGPCGQQVRPRGGARRRQGAGQEPGHPVQLRLHGDLSQSQSECERYFLRPGPADQQEVAREETEEAEKVPMCSAIRLPKNKNRKKQKTERRSKRIYRGGRSKSISVK